jgi:hypothetical protein
MGVALCVEAMQTLLCHSAARGAPLVARALSGLPPALALTTVCDPLCDVFQTSLSPSLSPREREHRQWFAPVLPKQSLLPLTGPRGLTTICPLMPYRTTCVCCH